MRRLIFAVAMLVPSILLADGTPFMAQIDFTLAPQQSLPMGDKVRLQVFSNQAADIASYLNAWSDIVVEKSDEASLTLAMKKQPQYSGKVSDKHLASSFVIDIEEPSTQEFISGFETSSFEPLSLQQIPAYVSQYISDTTYIHNFNIASVVARERSGDCTEFAVLTTALSRALKIPSRVVVGTVLMEQQGVMGAFGHAWTEVWYEKQWQILDAALYDDEIDSLFYLPSGAMEKEGFGFVMSLAEASVRLPAKVVLLDSNL